MNADLEQRLRAIRPAPPSAELDRRMDALFAASVAPPKPVGFPGWVALGLPAVGVAAAGVLFWLQPEPPARPRPAARIVYQIEPHGLMRELLLTPPAHASPPPALELRVRL